MRRTHSLTIPPELAGEVPAAAPAVERLRALLSELRKVPAYFRRDLLITLSYRFTLVTDWLGLLVQIALFSFVSRMVDPRTIPAVEGQPVSYLEFVTIGIAVTGFVQVGLGRVVAAVRGEQMTGTLEALLTTPTALGTMQLGSAIYDLVYVPIRTIVFLGLVALLYGVHIAFSNLGPALVLLAFLLPVVWGMGVLSAAVVLTFRRGSGVIGFGATVLTATSGAYFPMELLPGWAQWLMRYNPLTISLDATREVLLAGAGWDHILPTLAVLAPMAVVSLTVGAIAFRLALQRELVRGTLHLY